MRSPFWLIFVAITIGCGQHVATPSAEKGANPHIAAVNEGQTLGADTKDEPGNTEKYDFEWNDRNADIYRFLLAKVENPTPGRICYITMTPMSEWGENGNWSTIPAERLNLFPNAAKYLPPDEAYLKDRRVLQKGTDSKAWMKWISVKRWISETEVEVEEGVWCCPLGGGASTNTYEKIDDEWQSTGPSNGWVS